MKSADLIASLSKIQNQESGEAIISALEADASLPPDAVKYLHKIKSHLSENWQLSSSEKSAQERELKQKINPDPNADITDITLEAYDACVYAKLLAYAKLVHTIEQNGTPEEQAYKLAVLFENEKKALKYLNEFIKKNKDNKQPMHDACLFVLPHGNLNWKIWRKLAEKHMTENEFRERIIGQASDIEQFILRGEIGKPLPKPEAVSQYTKEIDTLNATFKKLNRIDALEMEANPQLQDEWESANNALLEKQLLFYDLGVRFSEQLSITALSAIRVKYISDESESFKYFIKLGLRTSHYNKFEKLNRNEAGKNIPDILIPGNALGHPGYYLKKIDPLDEMQATLAACLGKLTDCCQSLSGELGESCAIHGLTSPNGGFYVIYQGDPENPSIHDKVIAQSWAWRSKTGAIGLDSIEVPSNEDDPNEQNAENTQNDQNVEMNNRVKAFYEYLGKMLVKLKHTHKVFCGNSSGISDSIGIQSTFNKKELFADYEGYCDSHQQRVIVDINSPWFADINDEDTLKAIDDIKNAAFSSSAPLIDSVNLMTMINYALVQHIKLGESHVEVKLGESHVEEIPLLKHLLKDKDSNPERTQELLALIAEMKTYITITQNPAMTPNDIHEQLDNLYVNTKNCEGKTPLHFFTDYWIADYIVLKLIQKGADIDAEDDVGETPLICAATKPNDKVTLLIKHGANVNAITHNGNTALMKAAYYGHKPHVERLIENGANINATNDDDRTALMLAAEEGELGVVFTLIQHGADINARDNWNQTALMLAAKEGKRFVVSNLILHGAIIDAKDDDDKTALIIAAEQGRRAVVVELIEGGANVDAVDDEGQTALMSAAYNGHEKTVLALLEDCPDTDARNNSDQTALMLAAIKGYYTIVSILIQDEADINAKDEDDCSPLMRAVEGNHKKVVKLLLANGAHVDAVNDDGDTALDIAIKHNYKNIITLLQSQQDKTITRPPVLRTSHESDADKENISRNTNDSDEDKRNKL